MDAQLIRELKERSGAGLSECKQALEIMEGDLNDAIRYLEDQGLVPSGHMVSYAEETKEMLERRYRRRSKQGDAQAMFDLAYLIYLGESKEEFKGEYEELLQKAAEGGIAKAQWQLAVELMGKTAGAPPSADAVRLLQQASDGKHKPAARVLGLLYYEGRGVERNDIEAEKYLRLGAESGSTHIEDGFPLGYEPKTDLAKRELDYAVECFEHADEGWELPEVKLWLGLYFSNKSFPHYDLVHGAHFLEAAAEGGVASGAFMLARLFQRGEEKPDWADPYPDDGPWKDPVEAEKWFRHAADKGLVKAMSALADFYEKGRGGQTDEVQAAHWYHRVARADKFTDISLRLMVHKGLGISPNEHEEYSAWQELAAAEDNATAPLVLAMMTEEGRGVAQNPNGAIQWYYQAATRGSGVARFWLGAAYLGGYGMPVNAAEGVHWLSRAVENGQLCAHVPLALMLWNGHNVEQDQAQARKLLGIAGDRGHSFGRIGVAAHSIPMDGTKPRDFIYEGDAMDYARAAAMGFDVAQLLYGLLLMDGRGVPQDQEMGRRWIQAAARGGLPEAQKALSL